MSRVLVVYKEFPAPSVGHAGGRAVARLNLGEKEAALSDARESLALLEEIGSASEYPSQEVEERARQVLAACG